MNTEPEPAPPPCVQDLVREDIEARKALGLRTYGTLLYPHNGRDALRDAYEEALDLALYLRQALLERDAARRCRTLCRCPSHGHARAESRLRLTLHRAP